MKTYSTTFKNGKTFGVVKQKNNKFYYIAEGKKRPIAKKNVDVISEEKREELRKATQKKNPATTDEKTIFLNLTKKKMVRISKNQNEFVASYININGTNEDLILMKRYKTRKSALKFAEKNLGINIIETQPKKATTKKITPKKTPAKKTPKKTVTPKKTFSKQSNRINPKEYIRELGTALNKIGIEDFKYSDSETKFGKSSYLITDPIVGQSLKVRTSDHSVGDKRVLSEIHLTKNNFKQVVEEIEKYYFPKRYKKIESLEWGDPFIIRKDKLKDETGEYKIIKDENRKTKKGVVMSLIKRKNIKKVEFVKIKKKELKPKKNKRVSVSILLGSDENKDVFLGLIYRLAKSVRGFVPDKQKKQRVSRQMNVISKGWKDETKEGVEKVGKMLAPFANDIMVVSPLGTKKQLQTWEEIYELYKSYNINPNRPKSDPYKQNKANVLDKLKKLK